MIHTIHRPVVSSVELIDRENHITARCWDWPSLGVQRWMVSDTLGGVRYPVVQGVRPVFRDLPEWAPTISWGEHDPTYHLPGGRTLVARSINHQPCFVELTGDEQPANFLWLDDFVVGK